MEVVVFGRTQTQKNSFLREGNVILCKLNAFHRNDTDQNLYELGFERAEDWKVVDCGPYISGWRATIKHKGK